MKKIEIIERITDANGSISENILPKGALEALAEVGLEPAGPIRYGRWDENWGRAATRLLLDQGR